MFPPVGKSDCGERHVVAHCREPFGRDHVQHAAAACLSMLSRISRSGQAYRSATFPALNLT